MRILKTPSPMREAAWVLKKEGRPLGLVPTMGALHEGHLSLIRRAVAECPAAVVSIFVNPTQFSAGEDLGAYPRALEEDVALCRREGVSVVYAPDPESMYPAGFDTWVEVPSLAAGMCGPHRPGHFKGVATVVTKLFCTCLPDRAYFGEKDYQQFVLIRRMVRDLDMGVEIVSCPIVREKDGLALSSRNAYLNGEDRRRALALYRGLRRAKTLLEAGREAAAALVEAAREELEQVGAEVEYVVVVDPETLAPVERVRKPARMAVAARIGATRLIDNILLEP